MSDLISRTACLQKLRKMMDTEGFRDGWAVSRANVKFMLESMPSAEPEIIRCKDCKHRGEEPIADGRYWCDIHNTYMYYCSDAERRTDG